MQTITTATSRVASALFEWGLRLHPELQTNLPISYAIPPDVRDSVSIRWPSRLQWEKAETFVRHIREGLRYWVPLTISDIPQPYRGVVLFEVVQGRNSYPVAIDYGDDMDCVNDSARSGSAVYFKMQYRRDGYPPDHRAPVLPGGYTTCDAYAYSYLRLGRRIAETAHKRYDVFGRFDLRYASGIRKTAIEVLRGQTSLRYAGGATKTSYSRHLFDAGRSRVCLDLPGNGPFCFRLIDYLAVGACVVAVRHPTIFHVPLLPGVHIAYVREDLSDLVDVCRYYVENSAARQSLQREARRYFDRYLHKHQLAAYYLSQIGHYVLGSRVREPAAVAVNV